MSAPRHRRKLRSLPEGKFINSRSKPQTMDALTVDRDSEKVTKFFKLATSQLQRTEVPQHEVVVGPIRLKVVAIRNQFVGQGASVCDHLFGVRLPGWLTGL